MTSRRTAVRCAAATLLLSCSVAACSTGSSSPAPANRTSTIPVVTQIGQVDGIPTGVAASSDGREVLVSTQAGLVTRISFSQQQGRTVPRPHQTLVLDLRAQTAADPQAGGLLDVTVTPDGRRLLTIGNRTDGTIVLASFPYRPGARVRPDQGKVIFRYAHPYVHSGGGLAFDRRGNLLVSLGARTAEGEPLGPQNPDGVVARLPSASLDGAEELTVTASHLVARGLRNPWRISIDPRSDRLWVADVGENATEEINVVDRPAPGRPVNFGWPYFEGTKPYVEPAPAALRARSATLSYEHGGSRCAVVGGPVVRAGAVTRLIGRYVYGDYCSTVLRSIAADRTDRPTSRAEVDLGDHPVSLTSGPDGAVYVVGSSGAVLRLDPASATPPRTVASPVDVPERPGPKAAGAAGCAITAAIERLDGSEGFTPDRYRRRLTAVRDALVDHGPSLPADLRPVAEGLVRDYDRALQLAAASGWDPQAPDLRRTIRLTQAERGELARITKAEFSIMDRSAPCS